MKTAQIFIFILLAVVLTIVSWYFFVIASIIIIVYFISASISKIDKELKHIKEEEENNV